MKSNGYTSLFPTIFIQLPHNSDKWIHLLSHVLEEDETLTFSEKEVQGVNWVVPMMFPLFPTNDMNKRR